MPKSLEDLCGLVLAHEVQLQGATSLSRVRLRVSRCPTGPTALLFEPMLYFVLQGAKRLLIGDRIIDYASGDLVVMSVDLPVKGEVVRADPSTPYLALELLLDPALVASVMSDVTVCTDAPVEGFTIHPLSIGIVDALHRLIALLDEPAEIAALRPLIEREIIYRVLRGSSGALLRQVAVPDSRVSRIAKTIQRMRFRLEEPLSIGELADVAGMSVTSFHRHFRDVTAMTPIAYLKRLRLLEARKRLISEPGRAAHVAISVGYESASQFSREYKREFGCPPARDAARLRRAAD